MIAAATAFPGEFAVRLEILSAVVQELCGVLSAPQAEFITRRLHERITPVAGALFDSTVDEAAASELAAVLRSLGAGAR